MMAERIKSNSMSDTFLKRLALIMAVNCVRNTIIEDYHARGSLSQEDMKAFNKEVANKLYTFLRFLLKGSPEEREALLKVASLFYPSEWDQPVMDTEIKGAIKLTLEHKDESG